MTAYHIPALLSQSIEGLAIKPGGVYVDATYGGGGHSKKIFEKLTSGNLLAFDQDIDAKRNLIISKRFFFANHNFRFLTNFLSYYGFSKVDGILADLGVSFHHFDESGRGFSFRSDGPLDMRMNTRAKCTASTIVNSYSLDNLASLFREYGEVANAGKLSQKIVENRKHEGITTINQFIDCIKDCIPHKNENKYLAKVFQALRIEVNQEMEALKELLLQIPGILNTGGRLVAISYHSLEDKLVKNFIKTGSFGNIVTRDIYGNTSCPFKPINKKVIIPDEEEIRANKRARSAKLRIAERI